MRSISERNIICRVPKRYMSPLEIRTTSLSESRPVELNYPARAGNLVKQYLGNNRAPDTAFYREMREMGINRSDATMLYRVLDENPRLCKFEYTETEYARYYKYLPSEKYKQRHFEARGTFTIPPGIDPDSQKVYDMVEKIFDIDVMGTLGIEIDDSWTVDWISGAEKKGTTDSFNRSVEVIVVDKIRTSLGPYKVNVPMNEADFGEPKPE